MPGSQDEPVAGMEASSIPGSASSSPMSISSTSSTPDIWQPPSILASHLPSSQDNTVSGMSASSLSMSISSTSSTRDIQQPLSIPASHMPSSRGDTVSGMSASSLSMSISSTSSTPDIQQPPSMPASGITPPWRRADQVTPPWRHMNQVNATDGGPSASSSGQQSQQHFPGTLLIGQAVHSEDIHHPRPVRPISGVASMWEAEGFVDEL